MRAMKKRPYPYRRQSYTALSIFAIALSLYHNPANAASLRANQEDGADPGGSGPGQRKRALTAKLSTSSHPRKSVSAAGAKSGGDALEIPLVGIGVGNLPHNKIPYLLASALSTPSSSASKNKKNSKNYEDNNNYRLIDTSHTDSALEVLVGRSLSRLSDANDSAKPAGGDDNDNLYHVMIKIWHTHLGYERTMLSVQDSLSDILPKVSDTTKNKKKKKPVSAAASASAAAGPDVRVHAILQYPRCYDTLFSSPVYLHSHAHSTKYTNCQQEEDALDLATRNAGPSPLLDKENSWKRSYRALEELYHHGTLESIGISNFGPADLKDLFEMATVGPHVYQGSLNTLLLQQGLVEELVKHGVHYQVYDAASVVVNAGGLKETEEEEEEEDPDKQDDDQVDTSGTPLAYAKLERIGARHGTKTVMDADDDNVDTNGNGDDNDARNYGYSPVQVVLGWLIHHKGVGVVPGTTDLSHLAENSPASLGSMPKFNPREALDIENAVLAIVTGHDLKDDAGKGDLLAQMAREEVVDLNGNSYQDGALSIDTINGEFDIETGDGDGGVVATFFNTLPRNSVRIFQVHPESGEQMQISHSIPPGRSGRMIVNWEDVLIAYDGHGVAVKKFLVEEVKDGEGKKKKNGSVDFSVESS